MHFLDGAEPTPLDEARRLSQRGGSGALIAHLRGDLLGPGEVAEEAGLGDRLGQRLLAEAVLAEFHRHGGSDGVRVVGGADGDGVDLLPHLVDHHPEIGVGFCPLKSLLAALELIGIDVGHRHHLAMAGSVGRIALPLAADADAAEADLLIGAGGRLAILSPHLGSDPVASRHSRRDGEEIAARSSGKSTTAGTARHGSSPRRERDREQQVFCEQSADEVYAGWDNWSAE